MADERRVEAARVTSAAACEVEARREAGPALDTPDGNGLLDYREYSDFWIALPDDRSHLDRLTQTLIAHVEALQDRIDQLPHPDDVPRDYQGWSQQCACGYDHPSAVCMVHETVELLHLLDDIEVTSVYGST